jgi:signal transduction histidine kinase
MRIMSAGPVASPTGKPRRRLLALALLLVLSLTLAAGLAWQAVQTARRHRATAEHALQDYAAFAAFTLASQIYRSLGAKVVETFTAWPAGGTPAKLPPGTACAAGTTFLHRAAGDSAVALSGAPLAADAAAFLRDTLRHASQLLEEVSWRFRFVRAPAGGPDGWFFTTYPAPSGGFGLRGFSACLGSDSSMVRLVMLHEPALPPVITGDLAADSMFTVTLAGAGAGGRALYASPVDHRSPYRGGARLGTEFGDLRLEVQLRPDLAKRLVIGGIPRSPTPLAAGLLALSTLLVVTALLQLRREYELITIRSEFVSNVSHELRTPLSQILIFTELLRLGRLRSAAERDRSLAIIDQEARRLIRLVENVLRFSGSARRRMEPEALPVATIVRETLDAFDPLAAARGVTLRSEVAPGVAVRADPGALRQVLLNLLDNAVKYGPRGQTVRVDAYSVNGSTRIVVDDQGPGIPPDDRDRIWQGYYRLPREAGTAVAGSGIGLAVVRSLMADMDGKAWVEDTESGGARFVVELARP